MSHTKNEEIRVDRRLKLIFPTEFQIKMSEPHFWRQHELNIRRHIPEIEGCLYFVMNLIIFTASFSLACASEATEGFAAPPFTEGDFGPI